MITGRGAQGTSGGNVESTVVERALDDASDDEAFGQVGILVGAKAVGGVEFAAFEPVDGNRAAAVVQANDVVFVDVFDRAGLYPFTGGGGRGFSGSVSVSVSRSWGIGRMTR